jgi:hypothetical protein
VLRTLCEKTGQARFARVSIGGSRRVSASAIVSFGAGKPRLLRA